LVKRGGLWTGAGSEYAKKPRPVLVLQDDSFPQTDSVTVALLTSDPTVAPLLRFPLTPDAVNNLSKPCSVMIDKVTTTERTKLRQFIGILDDGQMAQISVLVVTFLGLARGARDAWPVTRFRSGRKT
jgi:mRNA interferase MazF